MKFVSFKKQIMNAPLCENEANSI
jgi:hypothetical protein